MGDPHQQEHHQANVQDGPHPNHSLPRDVPRHHANQHREQRVGHAQGDHVVAHIVDANGAGDVGLKHREQDTLHSYHVVPHTVDANGAGDVGLKYRQQDTSHSDHVVSHTVDANGAGDLGLKHNQRTVYDHSDNCGNTCSSKSAQCTQSPVPSPQKHT